MDNYTQILNSNLSNDNSSNNNNNNQPQNNNNQQSNAANQSLITYLPFHLQEFWDKFYTSRGEEVFDWYFDLTALTVPEFDYMSWPKESMILVLGTGPSSFLDYFYNQTTYGKESIYIMDFSPVVQTILNAKYPMLKFELFDITDTVAIQNPDNDQEGAYDIIVDKGCIDCILSDPKKGEEKFVNALKNIQYLMHETGTFYYFSTGKPEERNNLFYKSGIQYQVTVIDLNMVMKEQWKDFNQGDNIYYLYTIKK